MLFSDKLYFYGFGEVVIRQLTMKEREKKFKLNNKIKRRNVHYESIYSSAILQNVLINLSITFVINYTSSNLMSLFIFWLYMCTSFIRFS